MDVPHINGFDLFVSRSEGIERQSILHGGFKSVCHDAKIKVSNLFRNNLRLPLKDQESCGYRSNSLGRHGGYASSK